MTRARLLLLFAAIAVAACNGKSGRSAPTAEPSAAATTTGKTIIGRLITVSTELVDSGRVVVAPASLAKPDDDLTVTGETTAPPDGAAEIGAPIGGIVRQILAKEGDRVDKGQTLASLDAAEVARTVADLGRAEARRDRAARVLRQEEELMRGNATSQRNLAEARSELAAAEAEVRGARTLLSTFGAAGGGRVAVKSPIAGTVVVRTVVLGKPVDTGARLFRVVNGAKLVVRADVPENDVTDVREGAEATLSWTARGTSCKGTVESRAPSVDPTTRTVPFRVRPGQGCPELVEGGFVDVTIPRPAGAGPERVTVPRDALVEFDAVPVVFVATGKPGEFRSVSVRVERLSRRTAYIEDGIDAGTSVVVKGAILLKGELMRSALE